MHDDLNQYHGETTYATGCWVVTGGSVGDGVGGTTGESVGEGVGGDVTKIVGEGVMMGW
jgi:hypothetical protein